MSEAWDPFSAPNSLPAMAEREERETQARRHERELLRITFGTPQGAEWLRSATARMEAQPSYRPGMGFDEVAFHEGRKSIFREIMAGLSRGHEG